MGLIADVFNVVLIDEATNEAIGTTTLQDANIEVSVSENEVRAGQGNTLIGTLHVSRDIAISLTDVEFKYDWLARQLGQDVKTGAGIGYAMPQWYDVADDAGDVIITLNKTPKSKDSLAIYDEKGVKIDQASYTLVGDEVAFSGGVSAGDKVEVRTFAFDTPAETQTIDFDSKVFGKGLKAVLETVEIDGDETITHTLQYQFDSAVPDGNFSVSTASERNAATQAFNLKVIKPKTSTVVGRLVRFPYQG